MTTKEKVEKLETEIAVEQLTLKAFGKEFQIYPWMKGRLFHKIITGNETLQKKNLKLYFRQIVSIFYGVHNFFRKYDLWILTSSLERRPLEGKYFDKLFDYIGNYSGYKSLIIELRVFSYIPFRKIASRYAMSQSFFIFFEEIYGRLFMRKPKVNDPEILKSIINHIPGGIDSKGIIRKYLSQYRMMKFWLSILPNPKLVLLSVSYTNFGYIRAFKERGIEVVEMQHGIITKNHHAYYYKKKFDNNQFPDSILTVGEKELNVFSSDNHFPTKEIIPVGSYIIDYYATKSTIIKENNKPKILFTLQDGQIGIKLIEFILKLKECSVDYFDIIIQPRRTTKENLVKIFPELKEIQFSDKDFYSAIIAVDVHATVYSTTAIESLSLGIPNILINIDRQSSQQLGTLIGNNPYTQIVNTVEEFIENYSKHLGKSKREIQKSNEFNIKEGYIKNITEFLKSKLG